jgi:isoquinoline 1-oxidoreductase alpha subunit
MVSLSRRTHTENARKLGLAARIRHRRILDDLDLKRQGGRHAHSLEELLTRRDRAPQIFTDRVKARDEQGRFVGASVVASLQSPGLEEQPWTHYTLMVNGQCMQAGEVAADMPLLWVLRDGLNLKGVKYGCGVGACGACTVLLDGQARRACQIPISAVGKRSITTVEGLSADGSHPLQRAWMELDVPQCGYCQAGQLMAAAALLGKTADPTDDEINAAMNGNICRCGTYLRIRSAIHLAARLTKGSRDGGNP